MNVGTKTLIFGPHNPIIHGALVALAWKRLFKKWPTAKELVCILIHDIGYWGCAKIENEEGQDHPRLGAEWAGILFGKEYRELVAGHSRFYAKKHGYKLSRLFAADKLSICLTPWWFYLPFAKATGELAEYIEDMETGHYGWGTYKFGNAKEWHDEVARRVGDLAESYMAGELDNILNITEAK